MTWQKTSEENLQVKIDAFWAEGLVHPTAEA
jgi:hypothetical protein